MEWEHKHKSMKEIYDIKDESERVSAIYDYFHEEDRLNKSLSTKVEFLTTIRYIEKVLKPGDKILDLGAGTGIYSLYFAEQGYDVTAVELANRNVDILKQKSKINIKLQIIHGNALDLSLLEDRSFNVVLLFGPLYHLDDEDNRNRCIMEARRVLKDDGVLFVAYINHDMVPLTETLHNPEWFAGTTYDHTTFRLENFPFVFFNIEECRSMLFSNDLYIDKEIASDGFSEILANSINKMSENTFQQYLKYHFTMCEKRELLSASNHLLFQCHQKHSIHISYPDDEDVRKEFQSYLNWPVEFNGFDYLPELREGDMDLICTKTIPADPERNWVPAYHFDILVDNKKVGFIDLRIGYNEGLYYGGNIGYAIDEAYRGHNYAGRACRLLPSVAKIHGMKKLIISNEYRNLASRRVCEKIGAKFIRTIALPKWNDIRTDGHLYENLFVWEIE